MPRKGISQADLVQTAVCMIEEDGLAAFSLGKLAGKLGIRTASLYNHIESLEKLQELVDHEAVSRLVQAEWRAIDGKQGDLALFGLADAYRTFVREHYQLYRVIMSFPNWNNPTLEQEAGGNRSAHSCRTLRLWFGKRKAVSLVAGTAFCHGGFCVPRTGRRIFPFYGKPRYKLPHRHSVRSGRSASGERGNRT